MIKRGHRYQFIILAAAMAVSCAGCEKRAEVIEGNTEVVTEAEKETQASTDGDKVSAQPEERSSERWSETITGEGDGFESINVNATLYDYSDMEFNTYKVKMDEFGPAFAEEMCDRVFDKDTVQVFDYGSKTKAVYDELIGYYEDTEVYYDFLKEKYPGAFNFYVYGIMSSGYFELRENLEPMERSEIEKDVERLKDEREKAPETLPNDYSYQGYTGKINGEDYYMYFGNRNLDEYMSSPVSTQWNGRVITIMKRNLQSEYQGKKEEIYFDEMNVITPETDADSPLYKNNSIISDGGSTSHIAYVNVKEEADASYVEKAGQFLEDIGYGDYIYNPDKTEELLWGNAVTDGFIFANGYKMSIPQMINSDGWVLRFELKPESADILEDYDITTSDYVRGGDSLDYNSYIDVMVNEKGIVGCQIYNPVTLISSNPVDTMIDRESLKDIVRDSVNDKEQWNIPTDKKVNTFDVENVKLIQFPVQSEENPDEYTFIPCYVVYKQLMDKTEADAQRANTATGILIPAMSQTSNPFILINAIDGSIINAETQLDDYPKGIENGNVGYVLYLQDGWKRYEKKTEDTSGE